MKSRITQEIRLVIESENSKHYRRKIRKKMRNNPNKTPREVIREVKSLFSWSVIGTWRQNKALD